MSILAPGMTWAPDRTSYDLYIKLEADGITADIALQSLAVVTIQIQDVNVPPMWMGVPAFYLMEATLGANMAVGMVSASDPNGANVNAPANWYNVTYSMTKNADWKAFRDVFSLTPQGALTLVPNLAGSFEVSRRRDWWQAGDRTALPGGRIRARSPCSTSVWCAATRLRVV